MWYTSCTSIFTVPWGGGKSKNYVTQVEREEKMFSSSCVLPYSRSLRSTITGNTEGLLPSQSMPSMCTALATGRLAY